jgi:Putative restriction endonuclease
MSTRTAPGSGSRPRIPPLEHGDRLTRDEFERRYNAMPKDVKAELIEGVVYMSSPTRARPHGLPQLDLDTWLGTYRSGTPGTDAGGNTTVRLDLDNEPQPDGMLFVLPEFGGQIRFSDDEYIEGAPELTAEISASSTRSDLGPKLTVYQRNGVREYLVWRTLDGAIDWFALRAGGPAPIMPDASGIARSEFFPGLWLDVPAMLRRDLAQVLAVLQQGLSSPEHARFVADLQDRRTS